MNAEILMLSNLIAHKKLAYVDFGTVQIVKPTGKFIDQTSFGNPDYYEPRHKFMVEIKTGLFSKKWVSSLALKPIANVNLKD